MGKCVIPLIILYTKLRSWGCLQRPADHIQEISGERNGLKNNMLAFSEILLKHQPNIPLIFRTKPLGDGKKNEEKRRPLLTCDNQRARQNSFAYTVNGILVPISTLDHSLPSKTFKHSMRQAITSLNIMFSLIPLQQPQKAHKKHLRSNLRL